MHSTHDLARGVVRHLSLAGLGLVFAASCAKKDQASREATPPASAASAPLAAPSAAPSAARTPSGSPGAGATESPDGTIVAPGPSARNGPAAAPKGPLNLADLKLPAGFSIELYSADVPHARSLALGPKGVVFVSNRTEGDKVYALIDTNGDHRVERVQVVAEGLDTPNGIAYRNGSLFIAEVGRLLRLDGIDRQLAHPPEHLPTPQLVTDQLPKEKHHGWRYIRFGPDGLLYMPIGAPCNLCERDDPRFASIARMKPDGSGFEVFASGVRNSVGFDWHPQTKELWFTDNGRDELGDDQPGDELDHASRSGQNFGFPYCHAGNLLDPEFGKGKSCARFEPPVQVLGPHVAALGMRFYTGQMFPEKYRHSIVIAEHGSWNRAHKSGYRVMAVELEGQRAVSYQPLISGWLNEQTDEPSGRPVDVEMLDDGSLLVSDDYRGAVYRVTYHAPS
jgi:glucose/arabinose dehydrogenase